MTDEDEVKEKIFRPKEVNKQLKELNKRLKDSRSAFELVEKKILSEISSLHVQELEKLLSLLKASKYINCNKFSCVGEITSCEIHAQCLQPGIKVVMTNWATPFLFSKAPRESYITLDSMSLFEPCSEKDYKQAIEKLFKDKVDDR